MRALSNEKDFYIKNKLIEDELISKKADDVFNNFFKEEINKMEEEKVVDIKSSKDKINNKRKILSIVATLVIVFLGANVYAATQGYNNIFFIIRNLVKQNIVTDKSEILTDREIIISYQPIKIAEGLSVQINKLIIKDNQADLYIDVSAEEESKIYPYKYIVYDITSDKKEISSQKTSRVNELGYTEKIKLNNISDNTTKLQLEIYDKTGNNLSIMNIDLDKKEIDIVSGMENEMQKLSEVELKQVLSKYAILNCYNDYVKELLGSEDVYDKKAHDNNNKVYIAIQLYDEKYPSKQDKPVLYRTDDIHKIIKEFSGEEITEEIRDFSGMFSYNKQKETYDYEPGDNYKKPLCLEIESLSFVDGLYTATFIYCYPENDSNIEELPQFKTTMKFKLNSEYEYTKYCLVDIENIKSTIYENKQNIDVPSNKDENIGTETDITTILSNYAKINFMEDHNSITEFYTVEEYRNEMKILIAMEYIEAKYGKRESFDKDLIHKTVEELTGQSYIEPMNFSKIVVNYDENKECYKYISREHAISSKVMQVLNTEFDNEKMIITFTYKYPKTDLKNETFTATIILTENKNYEFIKYRIEDIDTFKSSESMLNKDETTSIKDVPINEKVDNYASTMSWDVLYTPGLKTKVPTIWNVEVIDDVYSGPEDEDKVAIRVSGLARGINKETNEIIDSNMEINYYMPQFVNCKSIEEYTNMIANKLRATNTGAGYGDSQGNRTWSLLSLDDSRYYCHFEPVDDGSTGIGYLVEVNCDNFYNYKVINIENWIFGDIKTTSF